MLPVAVALSSSGGVTKSQREGAIWGVFIPIDNALYRYSIAFGTHTKMAEPIEMPFGTMTRVGPRNHVLDGGADGPREGAILGVVRAI